MKTMPISKQQSYRSTQQEGHHGDLMVESATTLCHVQLNVSTIRIPIFHSPTNTQGTRCTTAIKIVHRPERSFRCVIQWLVVRCVARY